ncbi:MAG: MotA/TolQ/ExbB proton channel family protein [Clostridiales bacterium]
MDLATIVGIVLGIICIILSILLGGGSIVAFIDYPSIMVVFGGTIASLLISFRIHEIKPIMKVTVLAFTTKKTDLAGLISLFTVLSQKARKEGLLSLEADIEKNDDKYIKNAMQLVVDGVEAEIIKDLMETEITKMEQRHKKGMSLFKVLGSMSPAWGMIGTLIGLVNLLKALDDPAKIGPAMAIALLTTLYGSLIANIFCIPVENKLKLRSDEETQQKEMIIEGILSIQSGENPKVTESKLKLFLSPNMRDSVESQAST